MILSRSGRARAAYESAKARYQQACASGASSSKTKYYERLVDKNFRVWFNLVMEK